MMVRATALSSLAPQARVTAPSSLGSQTRVMASSSLPPLARVMVAREQAPSSLAPKAMAMAYELERELESALETQAQERELVVMEARFYPRLENCLSSLPCPRRQVRLHLRRRQRTRGPRER